MNARQLIALLAGVLVVAGMSAVPPWRVLAIPPFGSGAWFGGYSPLYWPPHNPWTLPPLALEPFWNSEREYQIYGSVLLAQVATACVVTALIVVLLRRSVDEGFGSRDPAPSLLGAVLGGVGALLIGFSGVNAIMAPLLAAFPEGRVATTSLLLLAYLAAIVAATLLAAKLRIATTLKLLAGMFAGQIIVAYTVFVVLPDSSPESHSVVLAVWLLASALGASAGFVWAGFSHDGMSSDLRDRKDE